MVKPTLICLLSITLFHSCVCEDKESLSNNDVNYRWDEITARDNLNKEIRNRFGSVYSPWLLWLFISESEKNKIRIKNQEIKEIKDLAENEIDSPDNYKRIAIKEPYISYKTRIVRRPFKKIITEYREVTETVPYTDWRVERKKRLHEERLVSKFKSAVISYIEKKSYDYVFNRTNNKAIADLVKSEISEQLINKIGTHNRSLVGYLGKAREKKIETIIDRIINQERARENSLTQPTASIASVEGDKVPFRPVENNIYPTPSAPDWKDSQNEPKDPYSPSAPEIGT